MSLIFSQTGSHSLALEEICDQNMSQVSRWCFWIYFPIQYFAKDRVIKVDFADQAAESTVIFQVEISIITAFRASEYENIGSFHNPLKLQARPLFLSTLRIAHHHDALTWATKSRREVSQTTVETLLARRRRASSLLVWLNMRLSRVFP